MTNATTVPGGLAAREPATPRARTPAEIEADIERTRERLAGTVDAIADRVKPVNVARRAADSAKAQVVDADGNLRVQRVAVLAVVVAGAAGLFLWRRSR
jgi:hypothetical protein